MFCACVEGDGNGKINMIFINPTFIVGSDFNEFKMQRWSYIVQM